MITIIRYRNDTYFGLEGKIEFPLTRHSGYTNEENRIMKHHRERLSEFNAKREGAIFLNKVHAKKALDAKIPDWKEICDRELKDITYKLEHVHGFSDFDQMYKEEYTIFNLEGVKLEDLTLPTGVSEPK